ncbi:hypothetical protein [Demequina muriae]|uniref:Uncharacterized protein n=1 Tax=Demequina muriae TaxID=3051664 RepID=A0ABT8GE12_9MICO|nr:hypothetical protein [Demequina sp. EGI L300058]MDN4479667.1 hypothetical protein [Demequina sp. EGI L300058]
MEPVEELVRVRVPDRTIEVRVHGVSGTPPEALLGAFPVRVAGDADAGFYRAHDAGTSGGIAEAFSWGGLTSRKRITALWLFLAPLSLINVAGWMTPTHSLPARGASGAAAASSRSRASTVRDAAMSIVTLVATALIGAVAVQAAASVLGLMTADAAVAPGRAAAMVVLAALVPAGLHVLAKVGGAPDDRDRHDDPWGRALALRSLALAHLGVALAVIALVGWAVTLNGSAAASTGAVVGAVAVAVLAGAALTLGTAAVLGTRVAGSDAAHPAGGPAAVVGAAAVVAAAVATAVRDDAAAAATGLTAVHFVLAATAVIALGVAYAAERRMPVRESAGFSVSFAALGFFMSYSAFGALSYALLAYGSDRSVRAFVEAPAPAAMFRLVDFAAVVLTCGVLFIAARVVGEARPLAHAGDLGVDAAARVRRAVELAPLEVRRAGPGMLIAAGVLVAGEVLRIGLPSQEWAQHVGRLVTEPRLVVGAVGWLFVVYLLVRVCRGRRGALVGAAVAAAGVAALAWLLQRAGFDVLSWARVDRAESGAPVVGLAPESHGSPTVLGGSSPVDPGAIVATAIGDPWVAASGFTLVAVTVALFIPAVSVLWFVLSASGNRESRRGVGVLWDLTNFWPRLHHPWAPPPYSEAAIPALERRLADLRADHPSHCIVLSCHSQGAVLGFPAMRRLLADDPTHAGELRFLSYGTLLSAHYQRLFPHLFDDARLRALDDVAPGRWIHLFRETDPLGHPIAALGPASRQASHTPPRGVEHVLTHSSYGYSPEYQRALDDLAAWEG